MIEVLGILTAALIVCALIAGYWFIALRPSREQGERLRVVTTLFPLYDFAKQVGGDRVDVRLLLPPGTDAHAFEPKPSDILAIRNADVFIYTGPFMEPWVEDLLSGIDSDHLTVVNASEGMVLLKGEDASGNENGNRTYEEPVEEQAESMMPPPPGSEAMHEDEDHGESEDGHHHDIDPHVWLDLGNAVTIVRRIAQALADQDPVHATEYEQRRQAYESELLELDAAYRDTLSLCRTKTFVQGGHRSFGYVASRYGLNYFASSGFGGDAEPSVQDLLGLITIVREKGLRYVYAETFESSRYADTLARETGTLVLSLNPAANVSRDDFERGTTFAEIMRANLEALSQGLECKP